MSYEIDIISRMTTGLAEMSVAEKKIARFILDDIHGVIALPIARLAEKSGVSQATITRFARMLGCKDVRDLKLRLAQALAIGQRFIHEVPDLEGSAALYESIINILNINKKILDSSLISKAVDWIGKARQTIAIGMGGGSTICAQEIQHRFFRLGIPVSYYNDGLLTGIMAAAVEKNDVIIALSLGGYTMEIVESVVIARQYGAKVIAITPVDTPLAQQTHLLLPLVVQENDYIYKPSTSRYAMLALIDVLATELALLKRPGSRDRMRRIQLVLSSHREDENRQPLGD